MAQTESAAPVLSTTYADFYRRSVEQPDAFWTEQAGLIDWHRPFDQVCDHSNPPFARWFVGGQTNLCHNAVDRHLATQADQPALIFVSTETDQEVVYSFRDLHAEVQRMAACLQALGVKQGDRVLIYMPMIAEAAFAMLACARIGAIHSVVFGGFASHSLASRIDDAEPVVIVSADAGSRSGKVVPYKHLLDEAISLASAKPAKVLLVNRGLSPMALTEGRDVDHGALRAQHMDTVVPCVWLESTATSYTLYTSGTTGKPKGVQRDTGGYAVALAASIKHIFCGQPGETFFSTSDIGWVVGHSYIIYGPLIAGMATILYEGTADAARRRHLVEPGREVQGHCDVQCADRGAGAEEAGSGVSCSKYDLSSLRALFLAGEPLDEPTGRWIADALGKPDHRQLLADRDRLADPDHRQRRRKGAQQVRQPGRADVRLQGQAARRDHRRGTDRGRTRRAWWRSRARCRRAACRRSGATTIVS